MIPSPSSWSDFIVGAAFGGFFGALMMDCLLYLLRLLLRLFLGRYERFEEEKFEEMHRSERRQARAWMDQIRDDERIAKAWGESEAEETEGEPILSSMGCDRELKEDKK